MSRKSPSQLKILNDTLDLMTLMTQILANFPEIVDFLHKMLTLGIVQASLTLLSLNCIFLQFLLVV